MIATDHEVYLSIRERIFDGRIGVDTFVNIKELSSKLNVSALPVREALIRLASEDLLNYSRTKGYYVSRIGYHSLISAYENMYILAKCSAIQNLKKSVDHPPLRLQRLEDVNIGAINTLHPHSIDQILEGLASTLLNDYSSRLFLHELRRTRSYRYCIAPYREDQDRVISILCTIRESILKQDYRTTLSAIRAIRDNALSFHPINYEIYISLTR